jgi:hypothetical protein
MRVFLSYRRADDVFLAGRLRDRLTTAFGDYSVFFDVDSIPPGSDFRAVTQKRVRAADVLVALIGARWDLTRLARSDDYVRMELREGLRQQKPIIPVLIADVTMPRPEELPEDLATITFLNALRIRPDPDFHADSARLVEAITEVTATEIGGAVDPRALDAAAAPTRSPTHEQSTVGPGRPSSRGTRSERTRRGRRQRIGAGVALACVVAAGATLLVGALRGEDPAGQSGSTIGEADEWVAEVVDDGERIRTEDGDALAGSEPAWDVESQRVAYVPTGSELCGVCGVERGSDGPVELVAAPTDGAVLHAPAWSKDGSLYYARTQDCVPGPACNDDIVRTAAGEASTAETVNRALLKDVRDLEVDPQSEDDAEEVRLAFVGAQGAGLLWRGTLEQLPGGDVDDVVYSKNGNVIAGRRKDGPELEFWTRSGEGIESVDVRDLLAAAEENGIKTGLDVATVEVVSISATDRDQSFVVALRDGAEEVGAVEVMIPYNADPVAQLDEEAVVDGVVAVPYALHRGAELVELVQLRERSS